MGLGYISAGMLFLWNPVIHVVDILPDCIGYFLIYIGLFRASFLSAKLEESRKCFGKLIWITGIRSVSLLLLSYTDEVMPLLLAFSFSVLEAIYFIPAICQMFYGFSDLGTRLNTWSVLDIRTVQVRHGRNAGRVLSVEGASRCKKFTIAFFILRSCATVFPEFTVLESQGSTGIGVSGMRLQTFQPLFYFFACAIVCVCGLIWLTGIRRYLRKLRNDETLVSVIEQYYQSHIASNVPLQIAIRMKKVLVLIPLAAISSYMLLLDGVNAIPNVLAAVFSLCALLIMMRYERRLSLVGIALSVGCGVLSVVSMGIQTPYFKEYTPLSARYITGAARAYGMVRILGTLEYLCLAGMFVMLLLVFCRVLQRHSLVRMQNGDTLPVASFSERYLFCRKSLYLALGGAIVHCVAHSLYFTVAMYMDSFLIVTSGIALLWIVILLHAMTEAYENIYAHMEL